MSIFNRWLLSGAGVLLGCGLCFAQDQADKQQQIAEHNRKAQEYLHDKRPDLALPELQSLVALDPTNTDAVANIGVLLFFQGDCVNAVPQLRAASAQRSELWRVQFLLAVCEGRLGDTTSARTGFENVLPHLDDPKLRLEAGTALVQIYESAGDLDKAADLVATLRTQNPTNIPLIYAGYRLHTKLAGEAMLALSLVDPNSAEMHQLIGHEALRYGDFPGAIAQYREALKINPNLSGVHLELGDALKNSTTPTLKSQAEGEYKLAVELNSRDERALYRLAEIEADHGNVEKALTDYTRATELSPSDIDAQLGLAKVLLTMKKADRAQPILERVLQLEPENEAAHYQLSRLYWRQGRKDDANREVDQYKKYKAMKEKLRQLYQQMRITPPDAVAAALKEPVEKKEK